VVGIGKGVATNRNELGVELELKNSMVRLSEVRVMACTKKMALP
jgi:hypothetical protein